MTEPSELVELVFTTMKRYVNDREVRIGYYFCQNMPRVRAESDLIPSVLPTSG